jgi:hypothetical protein
MLKTIELSSKLLSAISRKHTLHYSNTILLSYPTEWLTLLCLCQHFIESMMFYIKSFYIEVIYVHVVDKCRSTLSMRIKKGV